MANDGTDEPRRDEDIVAFFLSDYAQALGKLRSRIEDLSEEIRRRGLSAASEERYAVQRLDAALHEISKVVFSV